MFTTDIFLLGVALAIDAAVATFALGLISLDIPTNHKFWRGPVLAVSFGFFQGLMLWLGSRGGYLFSFSSYGHMFHLIVGLIFLMIAVKLFQESNGQKKEVVWGVIPIVFIAIATSLDALAAGISFGTLPMANYAAFGIGFITLVLCSFSFILSQFIQNIPHKWLLRTAGVLFLTLVGRIIWENFSRSVS